MAANTRPYLVVFNGVHRMVEAPNPAAAVRHVVGAAVTELRPARGAEVAQWARDKKEIEIVGATLAADTTVAADTSAVTHHAVDRAFTLFNDWAGYEGSDSSDEARSTVQAFGDLAKTGRMDLMTFDVLRQGAPEFRSAIIALVMKVPRTEDPDYVAALDRADAEGLARVRAQLEEQPMPFDDVVTAVLTHAGILTAPDGAE